MVRFKLYKIVANKELPPQGQPGVFTTGPNRDPHFI